MPPVRQLAGSLEPLSSPIEQLGAHHEVVVVGSGYGGAIAASRLARAGREVVLLERGRELHPGEFPRRAEAAARHIQCRLGKGHTGDPRALFSFHLNGDVSVLSGCGLGGTSLINANVALRPDAAVLADERWPASLRDDPKGFAEGYQRAEEMLQPATYPESSPSLAKVEALRQIAGQLPLRHTPINVTFSSGPNAIGIHQEACNGCGDCVTGCNVGAKNTLLMNYLPDAVAHGAQVFTETEVRYLERSTAGWIVHVQPLGLGRDAFKAPPLVVTADVVVLGAGSLGTTGILLRSAAKGLGLSGMLGDRFTGNGDVLGFALRPKSLVNDVGSGHRAPDPTRPAGPCITAVVDVPDGAGPGIPMIIEDAVIPGTLAPLVPAQLLAQSAPRWLRGRLGAGPLAGMASILTRGRKGLLDHLQTFLVMGADDDSGRIVLDGEDVRVQWPHVGTSGFYEAANASLARMTASAGGTFFHDPVWTGLLDHDLMTVHPLGGCVMSDGAEGGVVDGAGRVFSGASGDEVHEGLYVTDGAAIPLPLGVNPLLTISALAERSMSLLAAQRGWAIDYRLPSASAATAAGAGTSTPSGPSSLPGIRFTERMSGPWSATSRPAADLEDYRQASLAGESAASSMTFVLTLVSADAHSLLASLATPMAATGTVQVPALSPEPLMVDGGTFQLLVADDEVDTSVRHMRYHLPLVSTEGVRYHFDGFKVVPDGIVTDAWPDTSTLYVTLRSEGPNGPVIGLGILRIAPEDFARQLRTMTVTGPVSEMTRLEILGGLGRAFAGPLFEHFGTVIHPSSRLSRHAPPRAHRPLDAPPPVVYPVTTRDGKALRITRYRAGTKGPVVLSHGMGSNPGLFTIDAIEPNLLEFLCAHGYDVWLQEWRGSTWLPTSREPFNADQVAQFDFPAAAEAVATATGSSEIHWLAHCVGGITVSMAALAGTIKPASLVISQVAAHPVGPRMTELKARMHAAALIRATGIKLLTTDSYDDESRKSRLFDAILRLYPIPRIDQCDLAPCRRLAFIYGIAFHHPALNEATHLAIHELFGITDLTMMNHLANCAAKEEVIANDGARVYLPHLDRLQFPITFLHGEKNLVWVPRSTERTYETLVSEFGPSAYRRYVFADHGHGDCMVGASAAVDVYPRILEHLERAGA